MSRKVPGVRIPPAPMGIKEKSFGGDSKRGPNHLREEKGTEGGPEGANPPCSDGNKGEILWWGFETRSRRPRGGERDRGRPRRGALVRAIPPAPMRKGREILWWGFETRSQPPTGGERDRGRPRKFWSYM